VLLAYGAAYAAFLAGLARPSQLPSQVFLSHSLFGMAPLFLFGAPHGCTATPALASLASPGCAAGRPTWR
jgi:hypothetical protein